MSGRIAAVIVLYRPDPETLVGLLRAIAAKVECVFLFRNVALATELLDRCRCAAHPATVQTLGTGDNVGLGTAYNEAARAAQANDCDLLLLFDEDSGPPQGMPGRLLAAFETAGGRDSRIAVIGPKPVPADAGAVYRMPPLVGPNRFGPGLHDVAFVISSGSLIDLHAFAVVGPFRADFFIDGIDIEWCFRARARGFSCVMALSVEMPHRLGSGVIHVPLLPIRFVDQPATRLITYARNQVAMMRLAHIPLSWKARAVVTLIVRIVMMAVVGRFQDMRCILRGVGSGFRGHFGPPE